jgi:putative glutamine amidotransferase
VPSPLIGLTGRRKTGAALVGTPEALQHLEGDWYYADFARGIIEAGGLPVHLPLDADPTMYVDRLDAIILTGGADVGPELYGSRSETDQFPPEPIRDAYELALLAAAQRAALPTLGICRGLQLINVACGGTLHQHVPEHAAFEQPPATLLHIVAFEADSVLGSIYGASLATNSLHHQTVDRVGVALRVTARAPDGSIEGLEHDSLPILAVQWHPEILPTRAVDPIFRWLVEAATA